jgi:LPXTG-motif cell wall-anchored protein
MKTVDLTKAENRATWNCTPDYGIPVRNYPGTGSSSSPVMVIAGGSVLVIGAGAAWYLLKKRSEKKQ